MPFVDLDGQEMDFRAEGGFVPIGRMEKADDVPARLVEPGLYLQQKLSEIQRRWRCGQRCRSYV